MYYKQEIFKLTTVAAFVHQDFILVLDIIWGPGYLNSLSMLVSDRLAFGSLDPTHCLRILGPLCRS